MYLIREYLEEYVFTYFSKKSESILHFILNEGHETLEAYPFSCKGPVAHSAVIWYLNLDSIMLYIKLMLILQEN